MSHNALQTAIQNELACLEKMISLLLEEQEALTRARIDQLSQISEQKTQLVNTLEAHSAARQAAMAAQQVPDERAAITEWLTHNAPALLSEWNALLACAAKAAQYNQSNGKLLQSREEANRTLINILNQEHDQDTGYSADGRHTYNHSRRPLDRA